MLISKRITFSPPQILVIGFAAIILAGALILMLPISNTTGESLQFIDALFTATSATCVTGLAVKDTGVFFSTFGQCVIMVLIQVGGLGFMTMATLFALVFKRKISLKDRLLLQEAMNQQSMEGIVRLIRKVLMYSLVIECCAAFLLAFRWSFDMPVIQAIYYGIFHAVTLFNNAAFTLFDHNASLMAYVGDPLINIVSILTIISGGLGFIVLSDLIEFRHKRKLSLQSKVVLSVTSVLILGGALVIFIFEFSNLNTLGSLNWGTKVWSALFQSVSPRTAGVSTLEISDLRQATQFFVMILMFIGASPSSTGGGIKTTTFVLLVAAVFAMIRGKNDIVLFRYRLAQERIYKALTITLLALVLIVTVSMLLFMTERGSFLSILFETTSAFGTVGMSMGLTTELTSTGKILICITMFAGRLGLLTLAYALGPKSGKQLYRHPEGKMIIG